MSSNVFNLSIGLDDFLIVLRAFLALIRDFQNTYETIISVDITHIMNITKNIMSRYDERRIVCSKIFVSQQIEGNKDDDIDAVKSLVHQKANHQLLNPSVLQKKHIKKNVSTLHKN